MEYSKQWKSAWYKRSNVYQLKHFNICTGGDNNGAVYKFI